MTRDEAPRGKAFRSRTGRYEKVCGGKELRLQFFVALLEMQAYTTRIIYGYSDKSDFGFWIKRYGIEG
jgi:hypothetical protein